MRIVFFTGGTMGSGRLVFGMSIANALERNRVKCKYTMVHSSPVPGIADEYHHIKIPYENEIELSKKNFPKSVLYKTIKKLKPDVLIVNHQWFSVYHMIDELKCKKIYLADYTYDSHFRIKLHDHELVFKPDQFDRVLGIEPFDSAIPMERINPMIIRNRDEILPRDKAMNCLGQDDARPIALLSFGYQPDHYDRLLGKYSYLEKDYVLFRLPYDIFPAVDYFNAFDLIVCGGGYNNVWEVNYFNKKAVLEPIPMNFSDQSARIKTSQIFRFDINGADQLVDIILNM
jgi:hypothetical protein